MSGIAGGRLPQSPRNSSGDNAATSREENACTDSDEYPRSVAKTAVAQICDAAGFHSVQPSALETLADLAIRLLCDTGRASQFYASLARRTQGNALDALWAVEDINGGGLLDARGGMASSDTLSDLRSFVDYSEEIPFCKPVARFPICKKRALTPSFSQLGEKSPSGHIPPWLPAFPDAHTYKATPVWNERKIDPRVDKLEQAKQRRKAERSLVSLHLRLSTSGASTSDGAAHEDLTFPSHFPATEPLKGYPDAGCFSDKQNAGLNQPSTSMANPFLLPPLPPGSKEVSVSTFDGAKLTLPTQNTQKNNQPVALPSIFEVFTPALEAATLNVQETSAAANASGGLLPSAKKRKPLSFDFGRRATQKAVTASLSLGGKHRKMGMPELKENEKDEKKKRAEQILMQGLEGTEMTSNDRH